MLMDRSEWRGRTPREIRQEGCRSRWAAGPVAWAYEILLPTRRVCLPRTGHPTRADGPQGRAAGIRCGTGA
jgi:hypothetical protein